MDQVPIMEMDGLYFDKDAAIYHPQNNDLLNIDIHEYQHFRSTIATFYNYGNDMKFEVKRLQTHFQSLKPKQKELLKMKFEERVEKFTNCIRKNSEFCFLMVAAYVDLFPEMDLSNVNYVSELPFFPQAQGNDIAKLRITLKQFFRDWSAQGREERDKSYKPIIECLQKQLPNPREQKIRVLLPGAGLGRLVFELASLGYVAQGNEFSYFMLLGSHFIINLSQKKQQFEVFPFANNFCNRLKYVIWLVSEDDPFESVLIPDVLPCETLKDCDSMSFVAGEFLQVYNKEQYYNYWDSLVTCFFIDTANNVLDYIDAIYDILKVNGCWINFGPLEYHYANQFAETSIELSWDDLRHYIIGKGFEISFETMQQSTYNYSKLEQKQLVYNCIFFMAIKK